MSPGIALQMSWRRAMLLLGTSRTCKIPSTASSEICIGTWDISCKYTSTPIRLEISWSQPNESITATLVQNELLRLVHHKNRYNASSLHHQPPMLLNCLYLAMSNDTTDIAKYRQTVQSQALPTLKGHTSKCNMLSLLSPPRLISPDRPLLHPHTLSLTPKYHTTLQYFGWGTIHNQAFPCKHTIICSIYSPWNSQWVKLKGLPLTSPSPTSESLCTTMELVSGRDAIQGTLRDSTRPDERILSSVHSVMYALITCTRIRAWRILLKVYWAQWDLPDLSLPYKKKKHLIQHLAADSDCTMCLIA